MPRSKPPDTEKPSALALEMGRQVRQAREQAGLSQAELATQIKRRQASVSDIENGKMELDASTLVQMAAALQRPLTYFFPSWVLRSLQPESLTPEQQSLLLYSEKLSKEDLERLLIQVRALAEETERKYRDWLDDQEARHS